MAGVQGDIAELRKKIELIMAEEKKAEDGIAVEMDIKRVLGLLIGRDNKNVKVYDDEIAVSRANISYLDNVLVLKRKSIALINEQINDKLRSLPRVSVALSGVRQIILTSLQAIGDKGILIKINDASNEILNAIRSHNIPDFSGFTSDGNIVEIIQAICAQLTQIVMQEDGDRVRGGTMFEMAGAALDKLFLWFIIKVFSDPAEAVRVFDSDEHIKASFQEYNIRFIQLPYVLSILLAD